MRPIRHHITTTLAIAIAATAAHATTPLPATGEGGTTKWGVREKGADTRLQSPQGSDKNRGTTRDSAIRLAEATVNLDIPAGPLTDTLRALGTQANINIVYDPPVVADRQAPQLKAQITAQQALTTLLKDTGLTYEYVSDKTVAIKAPPKVTLNTGNTGTGNMGNGSLRVAQNTGTEGTQNTGETQSNQNEQSAEGTESESDTTSDSSGRGIPEVLVKGARSLNADIERTEDDIQPYVVIDRKTIERSAASSVNDLLRSSLAMNYIALSSDQAAPAVGSGSTSTIALRGLAASQTLILIDGRRAGSLGVLGASQQADLNGIPLNSIERIEVLPATASGIYGGSATGGVVNVVLRHDYSGIEASLTYSDSWRGGGAQKRVDLSGGTSFNEGATSLMFSGSYSDTSELRVAQREFYSDYLRRRYDNFQTYDSAGYLNSAPPLGATANISSVPAFNFPCFSQALARGVHAATAISQCSVAPNLQLKAQYGGSALGSPLTHAPSGFGGVSSGSSLLDFVQNAGTYNLEPADSAQFGAQRASLLNDPSIQFLSATLRQTISPKVEMFLTLGGSKNYAHFTQSNFGSSVFTVNSTAPNNPFLQNIRVSVPIRIGSGQDSTTKLKTGRALAGVRVELSQNWGAEFEYSFDRSDLSQALPSFTLSSAATAAIASGALDVLATPPAGGFDLSQYAVDGPLRLPSHTALKIGSLRLAGTIASLPAGPLRLTTLLEDQRQLYSEFNQVTATAPGVFSVDRYSEQSSTVRSVYAEAQVPIVSEEMAIPWLREVDLQAAGRYDSYRATGGIFFTGSYDPSLRPRLRDSSIDPTVGLRIQPFKSVTFRASYGTGFFPPSLSQLNPNPPQPGFGTIGLRDPKRGNLPFSSITLLTGGNPNLKPEQSKTRSIGVILTPPMDGLRLSFDWTRIDKQDNIASVLLNQDSLNLEDLLPGVVIRDTNPASFGAFGVGPIIAFDGSRRNATRAFSDSYDLAASYVTQTDRMGAFEVYANATRLVHIQTQIFPAQPTVEDAGTYIAPSWQANGSLTWSWRALSATWATRYLDTMWLNREHSFIAVQGDSRLPSETYHDVSFQYRFGDTRTYSRALSGARIQVGIKNVFDTKPRFAGFTGNIYDTWGNPMLATYYVQVTGQF